jgi:signal transduction histidine kinase
VKKAEVQKFMLWLSIPGRQVSAFESAANVSYADADILVVEGVENASEVRRFLAQEGASAPVILVSDDERDRQKARALGCADLLVRPFERETAVTSVETALSLHFHREALEEKVKFDYALDAMADGVAILSPDLSIGRTNAKAKAFLGSAAASEPHFIEALKQTFRLRYAGDLVRDLGEKDLVFDAERPETASLRPLILEVRTSVARNSFRETTGIVATLRDVTEARLGAFQEEEFLNFISHKLRTPMAIVHKNASLFHKKVLGPLTPDQEKFMKVLFEKCCELVDSFEKLLGFTMLKSHKLDLPPEPIRLSEALPDRLEAFARRAAPKKLQWTVECPDDRIGANLNPKYFEMLMNALLENAVKFAEKDTVNVKAIVLPEGGRVALLIEDDGPGVPPEERERIFEAFYQVDKHRTLNVAGTGLGLAIARQIVTGFGGSISAAEAPGGGTSIRFDLPVARVQPV